MDPHLPSPARYFPIEKGIYEVAMGLKALGTSFGNDLQDNQVFQIDSNFEKFRANRLRCRAENLGKYYATHSFANETANALTKFVVQRLTQEHPQYFKFAGDFKLGGSLLCELTGEVLEFGADMIFISARSKHKIDPNYVSAFDALSSQVQEDLAVMVMDPANNDWLAAIHLCSASHWAAKDKIGKNFFAIHEPVPGIEKINRKASSMVDAMINNGPFVRFVWTISTDDRLNHNPEPPPGIALSEWKSRPFNPRSELPTFLRLERQVIYGLPAASAALFAIRVHFVNGNDIKADPKKRDLLRSALVSMSPESRVYKHIDLCMDEVLAWLKD